MCVWRNSFLLRFYYGLNYINTQMLKIKTEGGSPRRISPLILWTQLFKPIAMNMLDRDIPFLHNTERFCSPVRSSHGAHGISNDVRVIVELWRVDGGVLDAVVCGESHRDSARDLVTCKNGIHLSEVRVAIISESWIGIDVAIVTLTNDIVVLFGRETGAKFGGFGIYLCEWGQRRWGRKRE